MKTIGLIGGSTWVSSAEYYKILNQLGNQRLGGYHSASILMRSFNFHDFKLLIENGALDEAQRMLTNIAIQLEAGGADCLVICANTPHMFASFIQSNISIPLIHIAQETGRRIRTQQLSKVGLLGTKPTMEMSFYTSELEKFNIETIVPDPSQREYINATIFEEFSKNKFTDTAKQNYIEIIHSLIKNGAEGVILGCTEIPMLIHQEDVTIPVFDTMMIHCEAAMDFAINS